MKALVLGAAGFIGSNVVRALLHRGIAVRTFRRSRGTALALEGLDVETVFGDIGDQPAVEGALDGCDLLFHVAGFYPKRGTDVTGAVRRSVLQMRSVMEAARSAGVQRIVYTSSLSTIGQSADPHRLSDETDCYVPTSVAHPYYEAKWAMEQEAFRYAAEGLPVVIVNPTVTFGPWDVKPTSGTVILAAARGLIRASVKGRLNVVDVRDVAEGQVAAAESGRVGERYILGGWNVEVDEFARLICEVARVAPPSLRLSSNLVYNLAVLAERLGAILPGDRGRYLTTGIEAVRRGQFLNCSRAERELDLPRTPLRQTIVDTLAWFRAHGYR